MLLVNGTLLAFKRNLGANSNLLFKLLENIMKEEFNMNETVFVGIDVGKTGSFTLLQKDNDNIFQFKTKELFNVLKFVSEEFDDISIVVERLWSRPGNRISSTWVLAEEYGRTKGILESLGLEYKLVAPQTWQKYFKNNYGLKESKDYAERKENLFIIAKEIYPETIIRKYAADSVLIAYYAMKMSCIG